MDIGDNRLNWRTSSYTAQGADCVEVAQLGDRRAVRDSKDPSGPILTFTTSAWAALLGTIKTGAHGLP
ncbi:DUF397 domain-containing protein [Actinomadura sp. GTD37]|uniref:DUF397 domain-containing protein n=1 Tax=Actinomadura sp. GTD37 TaxID=1778030 RepID=UPI0035BF97C0